MAARLPRLTDPPRMSRAAAPSPKVCDVTAYGAIAGDPTAFRRNAAALARAFASAVLSPTNIDLATR